MKKILTLLLLTTLCGCTARSTALNSSGDQEETGARLRALAAREARGLKLYPARGALQIILPATTRPRAKLIEEEPARYELSIPIGTTEKVSCYLSEDFLFPAGTIKTLLDRFSGIPDFEWFGIRTIEAGTLKNLGYIYLEAEYLTGDQKYGAAKIIASSTMNGSFYCIHDEPGYKQTFLKIADSLAGSAYFQLLAGESSGYEKKQIDVLYLNDLAVGYVEGFQLAATEGVKRNFQFGSFLLPVSPNELMASDSVDITDYAADTGALISGAYYQYENGEEDHGIEIEHLPPGRYQVQGTLQGQQFSQEFHTDRPLLFSGFLLDSYADGSTTGELTFEEYMPVSPAGPTRSRIVLKELAGGVKNVEYSFHTARAMLEMDEKSHTRMNLDLGSLSLMSKREYFDAR
jgi:hypothetical protein